MQKCFWKVKRSASLSLYEIVIFSFLLPMIWITRVLPCSILFILDCSSSGCRGNNQLLSRPQRLLERKRERMSEKRGRAEDHGKGLPSTFPETPTRSSFSSPVLQLIQFSCLLFSPLENPREPLRRREN